MSDFLRRLEKILIKVVQRGGLPAQLVGKARLEQFIRGATQSDIMLLQLRLRELKNNPPDFLDLLHEIWEEEVREAERRKSNPTVRQVKVGRENSKDPFFQELTTEIKDLHTTVAELTVQSKEDATSERKQKSQPASEFTDESYEVQALKKVVKKLRQQVKVLIVQPTPKAEKEMASKGNQACPVKFTRSKVSQSSKSSEDFFCYRCGGDGHIASKCRAPVNEKKVIQKLIQSLRKARGKQKNEEAPVEEHNWSVKRSAVQVKPTTSIPEGLVGPSSVIPVKVNGTPCQALLDSGFVVTIIFEEWYNKYLIDTPDSTHFWTSCLGFE